MNRFRIARLSLESRYFFRRFREFSKHSANRLTEYNKLAFFISYLSISSGNKPDSYIKPIQLLSFKITFCAQCFNNTYA